MPNAIEPILTGILRVQSLLLAAVVAVVALPEATWAAEPMGQPAQWICRGAAKGAKHAEVTVDWYVEADGTVVSRSASWKPPSLVVAAAPAEFHVAMLDLSILYDDPAADRIGPSGSVGIYAGGSRRIDRSTVTFELDGKRQWSVALRAFPPGDSNETSDRIFLTGDLADPDLLAGIATAGVGLATVFNWSGRPLSQVRFDLGARTDRDRLYHMAWAAAERAAQQPRRCEETVTHAGFEPPPIAPP